MIIEIIEFIIIIMRGMDGLVFFLFLCLCFTRYAAAEPRCR